MASDQAICKCTEIMGHLEEVQELLVPRVYNPNLGLLALGDWSKNYYEWLKHVKSSDGLLDEDKYLMSIDSKYWFIHNVQRYFVGDLHCEKVLFTYQYPNVKMPTKLGNYFWNNNTSLKLHNSVYLRELRRSLEITLKKMVNKQSQMERLFVNDQLIKLSQLDFFKRKAFFSMLLDIISFQKNLRLVSFENMNATRLEGVRLIQQLACFNAETINYLFLWRFVLPNENPLLINYSYITDEGKLSQHDLSELVTNFPEINKAFVFWK